MAIVSPQGSKKRDRDEESTARLAVLDAELREQLALLDTQFRPTWRLRRALRAQQRTEAS